MGTTVPKNWLYNFGSQDKKKRSGEHNELHNSLREKNKIYDFLKEGTFFFPLVLNSEQVLRWVLGREHWVI